MRSYGVVLWEIITGGKPNKTKGLRPPECACAAVSNGNMSKVNKIHYAWSFLTRLWLVLLLANDIRWSYMWVSLKPLPD